MDPGVHCGTDVTGVTGGSDVLEGSGVLEEDGISVTVTVVAGSRSIVVKGAAGCPSSMFRGGSFGHADNLQSPTRHISGELFSKVHSAVRQILAQYAALEPSGLHHRLTQSAYVDLQQLHHGQLQSVGIAGGDEDVCDGGVIVGGCNVVSTGPSLNVDGGASQEMVLDDVGDGVGVGLRSSSPSSSSTSCGACVHAGALSPSSSSINSGAWVHAGAGSSSAGLSPSSSSSDSGARVQAGAVLLVRLVAVVVEVQPMIPHAVSVAS
jgi:hypothetical protein